MWRELSNRIRPDHLATLMPREGRYFPLPDKPAGAVTAENVDAVADPASEGLHFSPIDLRRSFPADAAPDVRTKYSLDKSWLLTSAVQPRWPQRGAWSSTDRTMGGSGSALLTRGVSLLIDDHVSLQARMCWASSSWRL